MAAFGQSTETRFENIDAIYSNRFVTIIVVREQYPTLSFSDNFAEDLKPQLADFRRLCRKYEEHRAFCGKARERTHKGFDYKTPVGERGFWAAPEPPAAAPPQGVSFPRWKDFARRRG